MLAIYTKRKGQKMKIFSASNYEAVAGAEVQAHELKSGDLVNVITVGEKGRGRTMGLLTVHSPNIQPGDRITNVALGNTRSGRPKLIVCEPEENDDQECLLVLKSVPGYRGGISYNKWTVENGVVPEEGLDIVIQGEVAQGAAGRMGGGPQYVLKIKKDEGVQINRGGRLYGSSPKNIFFFDGKKIVSGSPEEIDMILDA